MRYIVGGAIGFAAYMLYRWQTVTQPSIIAQGRAAQPLEIFTAINLSDPGFYAATAAGVLGARILR